MIGWKRLFIVGREQMGGQGGNLGFGERDCG